MPEPRVAKAGARPRTDARPRIVQAAFDVLAAQGSHAASVKEIAKAAGVAPGLVHYYFATKEALLLEVVRNCCEQYRAEMSAIELPSDPVDRTKLLFRWSRERALTQPGWYKVFSDLTAMALRDPVLAKEVSVLTREMRQHIALLVMAVERDIGTPLPVGAEGLAAVIMAAADGLVVRSMIDETLDFDDAHAVLEAMVVSLIPRR